MDELKDEIAGLDQFLRADMTTQVNAATEELERLITVVRLGGPFMNNHADLLCRLRDQIVEIYLPARTEELA